MSKKRFCRILSAFCLMIVPTAVFAAPDKDPMANQQPIPMVDDSFQFKSNTWGRYLLKSGDQPEHELEFAILNQEKVRRETAWWMEIKVDTSETGEVVTRVLLPETENGPGDALKAIVQIEGFGRPFKVPKKYLKSSPKDDQTQVGQLAQYTPQGEPVSKTFTINGRTVQGTRVEALDANGRTTIIDISPEVSPLGIVAVQGPDMTMELLDWGDGAETSITGKPVSLARWTIGVIVDAFRNSADKQ